MTEPTTAIPYNCEQVVDKLKPIGGHTVNCYVVDTATGAVSHIVGVQTRQHRARLKGEVPVIEDVYLLIKPFRTARYIDIEPEAPTNTSAKATEREDGEE